MCGIAGIFSLTGRAVRDGVARVAGMMRAQAHRGPDQEGVFAARDGRVVLGNSRLAIVAPKERIELPLHSADRRHVLAFNGELYDYRERRTELGGRGVAFRTGVDTEVLLEGLRLDGTRFLDGLDGMWAFAFYDEQAHSLVLGRDLIGERQLFYTARDGEVIFASEAHTVLAGIEGPLELDAPSAITAIRFHVAPPGATLVAGLKRVRAGHVVTLQGGAAKEERVQRLRPERWLDFFAAGPSDEQVMEQLSALIDAAVARRLPQDVPFAMTLSGGIDSTLIATFAAQKRNGLRTLFAETREKPLLVPGEIEEYEASCFTAGKIGSHHRRIEVDAHDAANVLRRAAAWSVDGLVDWGVASFEMLSQAVQEDGVKVLLLSEGPDELAGGYRVDRQAAARDEWQRRRPLIAGLQKAACRTRVWRGITRRVLKRPDRLFAQDAAMMPWCDIPNHESLGEDFLGSLIARDALAAARGSYGRFDPVYDDVAKQLDNTQKRALAYADRSLPDYSNLRLDRGMSARSVEGRTPHIAPALAEFYIAMPARFRFRQGQTKFILRKLVAQRIGDNVAWRRKQGFSAAVWTRPGIRDAIGLKETIAASDIFQALPFQAKARDYVLSGASTKIMWPLYVLATVLNLLRESALPSPATARPAAAA